MRMSPHDERFFSPDRDLAYCTPHLVYRAMVGLDPGKRESWIDSYLQKNNISEEELAKGAECLADYLNRSVLDPQYKQPFEALEASKFFDVAFDVQTLILAKIGQVYMSGFFTSIRDVTRTPDKPAADMTKLSEEAKRLVEFSAWFNSIPKWRKWLFYKWKELKTYLGYA